MVTRRSRKNSFNKWPINLQLNNFQRLEFKQEPSKSDELASAPPSPVRAENDEKVEMICLVCREFNAATLTTVNVSGFRFFTIL